jgi:hypothetical protein
MGVSKRLLLPYLPMSFKEWIGNRTLSRKFRKDFEAFKQLHLKAGRDLPVRWEDCWPCLHDATESTPFEKHYIFHLAWAARIVAAMRPPKHIDVSSALQFATIISAFVPTEYYELRPVSLGLDGLSTAAADLTRLPFEDRSVMSLSCMHVVEHVGLGRYGDALDPVGDVRAMTELARVMAPEGNLLFVVPVGAPRVQFNAHRVYSYDQVMANFRQLTLMEFSLITDYEDPAGLVRNAPPDLVRKQAYGCGCFWFRAQSR